MTSLQNPATPFLLPQCSMGSDPERRTPVSARANPRRHVPTRNISASSTIAGRCRRHQPRWCTRVTRARCRERSTRLGWASSLRSWSARARASRKWPGRTRSTSRGCQSSTRPSVMRPPKQAVDLVREGKAEALMKGSLHTDELMGAVGRARHRAAHRAPRQPLLRDGRAGAMQSR